MDGGPGHVHASSRPDGMAMNTTKHYEAAYFTHTEHSVMLTAHIAAMVAAWVFILPISTLDGQMLAGKRLTVDQV
jgi:hypothetical protein